MHNKRDIKIEVKGSGVNLQRHNKTILHCIATLEGGGAERQICYLAKGLVEQGWEVHVAILRRGTNYVRLQESGAVIHEIVTKSNYSFSITSQLVRLIRQINPALVQCWQRPMDMFASIAAIYTRRPYICVERTLPVKYSLSLKGAIKFCVAQFCSGNVSNSVEGKIYWDKWLFRKVPNVMIPNIIPLDEIQPAQKERESLNQIVSVGRLSPEKNLSLLVAAMKIVSKSIPDIRLDIIGTGNQHEHLMSLIDELELKEHVFLQGYRDDAVAWVKKSQLFISLSLYEGMPNAVMEAAAAGIPMLLSDIPSHRLYFNERSATFANTFNASAIAENILYVLGHYDAAIGKTKEALFSIRLNSRENISLTYIDFYNIIVKKRERRTQEPREEAI